MIKSVTVTNYLGETAKIDLFDDDPEHGMIIKNITGLGPPKANINMTDLSTMDGSVFNSARAEKRNIVIEMLFTYAPTIEDTRQRTYKYFPIKKPVKLLIETDNRKLEATGYVESNEPDIFSKDESNQISIICEDSYFYKFEEDGMAKSSTIDPLFEFEFSNEYTTEPLMDHNEEYVLDSFGSLIWTGRYIGMVFGSIHELSTVIVKYEGDTEVGVIITINISGYIEDHDRLDIFNHSTNEKMRLYTSDIVDIIGEEIASEDSIIITTIQGNKSVKIYHNGEYINILNAIDIYSDWIRLVSGENIFTVMLNDSEHVNIKCSVEYKIAYEGV